ncbi:hypothetical protein QFC22_004943 [Naganishia vaughanmartiniae]|uniref:Uncharacterized protein n=1 Tax=Naganishia vaughanmartiniae TaxID=1424756 RepID=A0ACC2WZ63_9TREE|nr:hypothetical protein QFC22_004943 [Naganishia vaughanmartiniae]
MIHTVSDEHCTWVTLLDGTEWTAAESGEGEVIRVFSTSEVRTEAAHVHCRVEKEDQVSEFRLASQSQVALFILLTFIPLVQFLYDADLYKGLHEQSLAIFYPSALVTFRRMSLLATSTPAAGEMTFEPEFRNEQRFLPRTGHQSALNRISDVEKRAIPRRLLEGESSK